MSKASIVLPFLQSQPAALRKAMIEIMKSGRKATFTIACCATSDKHNPHELNYRFLCLEICQLRPAKHGGLRKLESQRDKLDMHVAYSKPKSICDKKPSFYRRHTCILLHCFRR